MNERRRAEGECASVASEVAFGEAMQLIVEKREELLRGVSVRGVSGSNQRIELRFHAAPAGVRDVFLYVEER
jgi:hypothetical protein